MRGKTEKKRAEDLVAELPFSAVVLSEDGALIFCNRLAKKLLPPPWQCKRFLNQRKREIARGAIFSAVLEETAYFVSSIGFSDGKRAVFFLEKFYPFYESFSQALLESADELFREEDWRWLLSEENTRNETEKNAYLDGVIARTRRFRRDRALYLRLLRSRQWQKQEPAPCDIEGFFRFREELSRQYGMTLAFSCKEELTAWVAPRSLSYGVLNILQFIFLFSGTGEVSVLCEREKREVCLRFSYEDRGELFTLYNSLLQGKEEARGILLAPLLCTQAIFPEEQVRLVLCRQDKQTEIQIRMPAADAVPCAFFSKKESKEAAELERMYREFFLEM